METTVVSIDSERISEEKIEKAALLIKKGEIVAFPTETVYGLGGDALNPAASRKIYQAKGRSFTKPLIVLIASMEDLEQLVSEVPEHARKLAEAFWPGPLTMVLKKSVKVPYETAGGKETIAVRMTSSPIARALTIASGGFLTAPSANISGKPSPTLAEHVLCDLGGKIPMILDGGAGGSGIESTIIDLTGGEPFILRQGYIPIEKITEVIGPVQVKEQNAGKQYAPKAKLVLVDGAPERVAQKINEIASDLKKEGKKIGIIATDETAAFYQSGEVISLGSRTDEEELARHLYQILREFDQRGVDRIYSENFKTEGIGQVVADRLRKAEANQVIYV